MSPAMSSPERSASTHGPAVIEPTTDADREIAIVDAFVYLSDTLVADYDVIEFLHFLTERCVEFSAVDEAGVMLAAPSGLLQAVASSSERSRLLELFELQNRDGPCLDAYRSGTVVSSDDLALDSDRWPTFAPQALDVGFRAVHSVPLKLRDEVIGALNLLRVEPGGISERDAKVLRALSDIATVGILQERLSQVPSRASGLQTALASRIFIEQAKGILAERNDLQIDEAFVRLRTYARHNGLRLTDVATGVINRTIDL
jgi:GAF domain-containing protein